MPDININPQQKPPSQNGFTTKSIDQPILDTKTKSKFSAASISEGGFKGFYNSNKAYIWAISAGIIIIAILAFFAFRKVPVAPPKEADINITVDAPTTAPSGGQLVYKINVENRDAQKLTKVQLELVYPDGVTYVDSTPKKSTSLSHTTFDIPDLLPKDQVAVFVKTRITGSVNDTKTLGIKLHYSFANFNSEFVKNASYDVRLTASDVTFEFDGPTVTNNAQPALYTLTYKNNSGQEIKNAQVRINFPGNFSVASTQPAPNTSSNIWNVTSLPANGQGSISFQGSFNGASPGDSQTFSADLLVLGSNGQSYVQTSTQYVTSIASVPLYAIVELENNNNHNIVNPGDELSFNVKYQNNSSVAATGVNILVTLDSKALDISSIQAEGGQVSGNTISWNASGVRNLENLSPSASGTLNFTVRVKNPATKDSSTNVTINVTSKIKANEYQDGFPGSSVNLKVSSTASVSGSVQYVSGSLPPKVGTVTAYKITLSVKNATNDFSDTTLTAFIPGGGFDQSTLNQLEANKVSYDSATGKLTWNLGALSAHTGDFKPARTLQFTVTLNPSRNQAGQSPTLVNNISLSAKDIFTNQDINLHTDDLSTADVSGGFNGQVEQ